MSQCTRTEKVFNKSQCQSLSEIMSKAISRRAMLKGTGGAAALGAMSSLGLTGCNISDSSTVVGNSENVAALGFDSVSAKGKDAFTVPEGYFAQILAPWGTRLFSFSVDGEYINKHNHYGTNSHIDQLHSVGQNHDGTHYFPLNDSEGILCINHEYIYDYYLHESGEDTTDADGDRLPDTVRKEMYAHGVSVVHIRLDQSIWNVVIDSPYNRRIHASTEMELTGAMADSPWLQTKFHKETGKNNITHGTYANCGNGYTPWGTYLTCEENWSGYLQCYQNRDEVQKRYGMYSESSAYGWATPKEEHEKFPGEFKRFNCTKDHERDIYGQSGYYNFAHSLGYIVEIDPFSPGAIPAKRTSLGRFSHEDCTYGPLTEGQPVVFYSGHDGRFEYIYKFVSEALWNENDAHRNLPHGADRMAIGAKYMDHGILYVARFDEFGKGEWLPLEPGGITPDGYRLGDIIGNQDDIIRNTLGAADAMGATPMDRPEWTTVDENTGYVYVACTNNTDRTEDQVNAANPRSNNKHGHVIRWKEGQVPTEFNWEFFIFGATSESDTATVNLSGLTNDNEFSCVDGIKFDSRGILWMQTDSGEKDSISSDNQILAVIPDNLGPLVEGEPALNITNQDQLKRFAVLPRGAESTGITFTPDYRHMFTNAQHPAEWPHEALNASIETPQDGKHRRPRSSTVVISRYDGGKLAE